MTSSSRDARSRGGRATTADRGTEAGGASASKATGCRGVRGCGFPNSGGCSCSRSRSREAVRGQSDSGYVGYRHAHSGNLGNVGYREFSPPTGLSDLVECAWVVDGPPGPVHVLPDGCMDLIRMDGRITVAGPDTAPSVSPREGEPFVGLRFRPGVLPRLL